MKYFMKSALVSIIFFLGMQVIYAQPSAKPITIGILVPMELPAMNEIVNGYKAELTAKYPGKIKFLVKNSQGDINIQRSILQEYQNANVNIVAPIGTAATQMAMTMIRHKPVVAIAAEINKKEIKQANNPNITDVLDEISLPTQIKFIHRVDPNLKKITLVHSANDKIFKQVKQAKQAAKQYGIKVQDMMIQQLANLYSVSQNIDNDSQAIFILKDELVVSGIRTLVKQAQSKHIPVIASDDGSVQKGAAFALGVHESQIGRDAAKLTLQILNGETAANIPIMIMKKYTVFYNSSVAKAQNVNIKNVLRAAKEMGYTTENYGKQIS